MGLDESNGSFDDLARARVIVQGVKAVPPIWMIEQIERLVGGKCSLDESVDRVIDQRAVLPGAGDQHRRYRAAGL